MPLPNDTTLSLQVHTNPGDPLHPKAKQAMIVRMSAETLEALEGFPNHPKMDFVFGNSPGIHIGDAFFPMRPLEEKTPHELYLRTSSAARPTTALKLYANVTGKFTVGRELVEKVENQIRDRAQEAEKQRTERKAILLPTPPDIGKPPNAKRKPEPQIFRRPPHAPDSHKNVSAPSGSQSSRFPSPRNVSAPVGASSTRVASPLPSTSQNGDHASLRKRLIHCVAIQSRTTDDVVKLVGGSQCDSTKRNIIITMLKEVAEPIPTSKHSTDTTITWQLKTSSWTEVRPYEWQPLDASVRTTLARRARTALGQLKIPETDPRWNHVRYRDPDAHGPTPAGSSKTAARPGTPDPAPRGDAKKGITTKEAKQKKAKGAEGTKKRANDAITARDEGTRPGKEAVGKGKERKVEQSYAAASPVSTPPVRPPARKLPGSGFKTKTDSTGGTPTPTPPIRGTSPVPSQQSRRQGPVDVRDKRPAPTPSSSARPAPPIPPPQATQQRKPSNNATSGLGRPLKKVKAPSPLANEIDFEREREPATAPKKRKKPAREEESSSSEGDEPISASVQKKRRLEDTRSARERGRERELEKARERHKDVSPQRKAPKREGSPLPVQRVKIKKEASPMSFTRSPLPPSRPPASDVGRPPSSASSSSRAEHPQAHRNTGSAKLRRRSPIYTSSEDESPEPPRPQPSLSKPTKLVKYKRRFRNPAASLPSDRESLRQYYRDCWAIYIALYSEKARFVSAYKKRLQNDDNDSLSLSDSGEEPQIALFDPEVAKAFAADLTAVEAEMHRVTQTLGERVEV